MAPPMARDRHRRWCAARRVGSLTGELRNSQREEPLLKPHKPDTLHPPFSAYSPGMEATAKRWLHISGQIGVDKAGRVAAGAEAQMRECWHHIFEILKSAGMSKRNLVKITGYLVDPKDVGAYREVRDSLLDGHEPASTLVVVARLANPVWLVEIEAVAAA